MNQWLKRVRNRVKLKDWWHVLAQKLVGHYQYYGVSGNTKGLQSYYYHTVRLSFKWINRRSQKRSYNWSQFNRFLSFTQVRFCEGAHSNSNLGANTPIGGEL